MASNPFGIGEKNKGSYGQNLFYFFKEFGVNPFDEEYQVKIDWTKWFWKFKKIKSIKVVKLGMSLALFNELFEQMNEHYKREIEAKANRKR